MSFEYDIEKLREPVRAGLHADPGAGKTRSLLTASSPLFVNIEQRVNGIADSLVALNQDKRIYNVDIKERGAGETPYEFYRRKILDKGGLLDVLRHEKSQSKFNTIMVDSLPAIADQIIEHHPHKMNDYSYWKVRQEAFYEFVDGFMSLPHYNILFVMHTTNDVKTVTINGKTSKTDYYIPSVFSKKVAKDLTYKKFKYTFHLSQSGNAPNKTYILQTDETDSAFARCTKKGALNPTETFSLNKGSFKGWDYIFNKLSKFDDTIIGEKSSPIKVADKKDNQETK